ncbi:MAG: hypothetical protein IJA10_05215 [Lachnospiraceae bacterium]|nr:hypothetical protein [Lachnospiraceae bacterium]
MINEERVKNMTRIAIYEKNQGKSQIRMSKYYKIDFVTYHTLQSLVYATIAFVMIGAAVVLMGMESLLEQINTLDYMAIAKDILILYGIWILVYFIISLIVYNIRYDRIKPNIKEYYQNLKLLNEQYEQEAIGELKKNKGVVINDDEFTDF